MTFEETKNKLDSLRKKKRLLKSLQTQLASEKAHIVGVSAVDYSKAKVKNDNYIARAEIFTEHIERLEQRISALLEEIFSIEDMISEAMSDLTEIEQTIIIERYMTGKSWKQIQKEIPYCDKQIFRIHTKAIKKIMFHKRCQ